MATSTQGSARAADIAKQIRQTRKEIDDLEIAKIRGAVNLWKANARLVELEAHLSDLNEQLWLTELQEESRQGL